MTTRIESIRSLQKRIGTEIAQLTFRNKCDIMAIPPKANSVGIAL